MLKPIHSLRRIAISTIATIAMLGGSATIAHSQMEDMGSFRSMADCEAKMQALLQAGRIRWYQCYPIKQNTQPQVAPAAQRLTVNISTQQLNKKWKHASDFGITTTKKNSSALPVYRQAILRHLSDPKTLPYGTYSYVPGSKVYFNPITNRVVILDSGNSFVSGWRITPRTTQFRHYINEGILR